MWRLWHAHVNQLQLCTFWPPASLNSRQLSLNICRVCGPLERDRWIGLKALIYCSCAGSTPAECAFCSLWYRWIDGPRSNLRLFADGEPGEGLCARLLENGQWSGSNCSSKLKSVCKKGDYFSCVLRGWGYREGLNLPVHVWILRKLLISLLYKYAVPFYKCHVPWPGFELQTSRCPAEQHSVYWLV